MHEVYSITSTRNDRVYYGRSCETPKRWRSHLNMLRSGKHYNAALQHDFTLYGEDSFEFTVLRSFDDKQGAEDFEQFCIDHSADRRYNISTAKDGGDTFTNNPRQAEIRRLKSEKSSGRRNPMYGKPKTEAMIQSVKAANSKKVSVGRKVYQSMTEVAKALGIANSTVTNRINSSSPRFSDWNFVE